MCQMDKSEAGYTLWDVPLLCIRLAVSTQGDTHEQCVSGFHALSKHLKPTIAWTSVLHCKVRNNWWWRAILGLPAFLAGGFAIALPGLHGTVFFSPSRCPNSETTDPWFLSFRNNHGKDLQHHSGFVANSAINPHFLPLTTAPLPTISSKP